MLDRIDEVKYNDIDDLHQLILNILQTIANVAEEPRARIIMRDNLKYIDKYLSHENVLIKEQAKITGDIIRWKP
jgi:hypothetical protein